MKKQLLLTVITALLATASAAVADTHAYIWDPINGARDLGSLGSDSSAAGINDSGTVVGTYVPIGGSVYRGFIWTEATGMVDLGVPGGGDSTTAVCVPTAINAAGHVVGYGRQVDGRQVAFYWTPEDGFTVLGDRQGFGDNGNTAYAINDHDQVTGNFLVAAHGIYHAYLWSPGQTRLRDLGVVDGAQYTVGSAINNRATVAGASLGAPTNIFVPMTWNKKTGMQLLAPLPDTSFNACTGINDAGEIIGYSYTSTQTLGFYTRGDGVLRIMKGVGGSEAFPLAINKQGAIVGFARDANQAQYGVLWPTANSVPQILPLHEVHAINNVGQVAGSAPAAP